MNNAIGFDNNSFNPLGIGDGVRTRSAELQHAHAIRIARIGEPDRPHKHTDPHTVLIPLVSGTGSGPRRPQSGRRVGAGGRFNPLGIGDGVRTTTTAAAAAEAIVALF